MNEKKFTKARWITIAATFLAFMGIGIVDPILPTIAEQIGANHWQVEMLFTAYILTMAIMMIPAGIFASRFGDKRMMVFGLCIVTVFALLCALSNGIASLSIFRAGWGFGNSMFFATAMTLLIALSKDPQKAVGYYEAAIGLGMAGGPLVGGVLGGYSWRFPFFATSILILAAFCLVLFFVFEPNGKQKRKPVGINELKGLFSFKPFLTSALAAMLYYYGFFVVLAYTPLIIGLNAIQIGFVFFGWGLMLAYGSAILSHQLEKKFLPKKILPYSLLIFALLLALLFVVPTTPLLITVVIVSGLASGLNNALFTSYVMEVSPYERSITSGGYNFLRWLGAAIAPVLSGLIGQGVSAHAPFLVAAVLSVGGIGLMLIKPKPATLETEMSA
ncbi:MFS transporter [Pseudalkalibacillus hwajinpoensis]|uniref:MFS transporter n=1 Tax=Guptibacillus hwajinpoensis TaxID=208199 RepID=UPI001CD26578|nr:MFS transporter [Pseudalkalibacillus hwajinpoensis]MCA0992253.1 MFS transporter [Pseudalkalibacillus hwajinpoensis]